MATRMLQAILFLKENRDLWTEATWCMTAFRLYRSVRQASTPGKLEEQLATQEGINETNR